MAGGCFKDEGPGELTFAPITTEPASVGSTTSEPTTSDGPTTSEGESTAAEPTGLAFRLATLSIVDPHFFLVNNEATPVTCTDVTAGLNAAVNKDVAEGGFNLVIYFDELVPDAEMRLFQGDCEDPGDGGLWRCVKKGNTLQTVFDTMQVESPCSTIDPADFQAVNLPTINDPPGPCVRTQPLDFSVAVSNSAGPLFLRDAQIVASPDSLAEPTAITSGVLYGFLAQAVAEGITVDFPLVGKLTLWSAINMPQECNEATPEQLPSIDMHEVEGDVLTGVWIALNFTGEKVLYTP